MSKEKGFGDLFLQIFVIDVKPSNLSDIKGLFEDTSYDNESQPINLQFKRMAFTGCCGLGWVYWQNSFPLWSQQNSQSRHRLTVSWGFSEKKKCKSCCTILWNFFVVSRSLIMFLISRDLIIFPFFTMTKIAHCPQT